MRDHARVAGALAALVEPRWKGQCTMSSLPLVPFDSIPTEVDAVVIGGGLAGGMAALRLASAGFRTVVFDRTAHPREKVCGCCLAPAGIAVLARCGLAGLLSDASPFGGDRARDARCAAPGRGVRGGCAGCVPGVGLGTWCWAGRAPPRRRRASRAGAHRRCSRWTAREFAGAARRFRMDILRAQPDRRRCHRPCRCGARRTGAGSHARGPRGIRRHGPAPGRSRGHCGRGTAGISPRGARCG
ncbi:MAG: FAD-binding protein [Proteobacteria bacterium]|nr:FAD-binding protein [Pseudomonadota bacterium]